VGGIVVVVVVVEVEVDVLNCAEDESVQGRQNGPREGLSKPVNRD